MPRINPFEETARAGGIGSLRGDDTTVPRGFTDPEFGRWNTRSYGMMRPGDIPGPGGHWNPGDPGRYRRPTERINTFKRPDYGQGNPPLDLTRGDDTTVPRGFTDPDRFGRMRPPVNPYVARIDNNPMRGANIGGGWNMYEGAPAPRDYDQPYMQEYLAGSGGGGRIKPLTIETPDLPFNEMIDEYGNPTFGTWDDYYKDLEWNGDELAYMGPNFPRPIRGPRGPFGGEDEMAGLSQTWQTILDRTGSEDLANQWLEAQNVNRGGIMGVI